MLLISKDEAMQIRKILGDYTVKQSHSNHPKYYLVEDKKNLKVLNEIRKH